VTSYRLPLALSLLACIMLGAPAKAFAMSEATQEPAARRADQDAGAATDGELRKVGTRIAQASPAPAAPSANPSAPAATDDVIGNVATLTGTVTVIRNRNSLPLHLRDDIFLNDTVQTSSDSSLSITFNDATTFNLSANARITIDNYVYEEGGQHNAGIFDIGKGTVAFVAAAVAKTGDMRIDTPTASLGIRGTTGLVEVPEGAAAAGANNVNIKLYPDADGRVGRIEVNDRAGQRLGALTQGASGFTIRPGLGGARPTAVPLTISPQQAARDQGFVRQVHAAQGVGRQIVTEQRALRRANPPGPQRQNQQRPNQLPGQNRPGQPQRGAPNRQGQRQPGTPGQPGPPRPGQNPGIRQGGQGGTPQPAAQPRQGGRQPPAPGLQRPSPGRPALQRPRPPAPKGKKQER